MIFHNLQVNNIEEDAGAELTKRHHELFIKITKRGPKAYNVLLDICKELGYQEAYKFLKPSAYSGKFTDIKRNKEKLRQDIQKSQPTIPSIILTRPSTTDGPIELRPYEEPVPLKHNVEMCKEPLQYMKEHIPIETYPMTSKVRGILFLVNIIDFPEKSKRRQGANIDKENLINLFRQMNFKIFYYENLYREQFDILVNTFASSDHLRKPDCLVFGLLTHGSMSGLSAYVEFADGGYYKVEEIIQFFSNSKCKYLIGKPKIFIFPFCRGAKPDQEINVTLIERREVQYDGAGTIVVKRYPSYSDIIICYATVPGYETHRDPELGSWYIQQFCAVMAEYSHIASFEEMLKIIHQKVGEMQTGGTNIQTPSFESRGFNKALYFNPGYQK